MADAMSRATLACHQRNPWVTPRSFSACRNVDVHCSQASVLNLAVQPATAAGVAGAAHQRLGAQHQTQQTTVAALQTRRCRRPEGLCHTRSGWQGGQVLSVK